MTRNRVAYAATVAAIMIMPGCADAQEPSKSAPVSAAASDTAIISCTIAERSRFLPEAVRETSGLAASRAIPGEFWTHNDSGNGPEIFALTSEGTVSRSAKVAGVKAVDWEDIEAGPCADGTCLFIADIGDNDRARASIDLYRIPEAAAAAGGEVKATRISMKYEDGPQDAESLFVLSSGDVFVVTKGRHAAIAVYRLDAEAGASAGTLVKVRDLFPQPSDENDRVTAATASPDGRWVGIRTYRNLYLYAADALVGAGAVTPVTIDLTPLAQVQGESVAITTAGSIWMTSEAEDKRTMPTWSKLSCRFPTAPASPPTP